MDACFKPNDLVWAKLSGYPYWPAFVQTVFTNGTYEVVYFGDFSRNVLPKQRIKRFDGLGGQGFRAGSKLHLSYLAAFRVHSGASTIQQEMGLENANPPKNETKKFKFSNSKISDSMTQMKSQTVAAPQILSQNRTYFDSKANDFLSPDNRAKKIAKHPKLKSRFPKPAPKLELRISENDAKNMVMLSVIDTNRISVSTNATALNLCQKLNDSSPLLSRPKTDQKHISSENKISEIEGHLKATIRLFDRRQIKASEISNRLKEWVELFLNNTSRLEQMFKGKIGALVIKLKQLLYCRSTFDFTFYPIYEDMLVLIESVKSTICKAFFKQEIDFDAGEQMAHSFISSDPIWTEDTSAGFSFPCPIESKSQSKLAFPPMEVISHKKTLSRTFLREQKQITRKEKQSVNSRASRASKGLIIEKGESTANEILSEASDGNFKREPIVFPKKRPAASELLPDARFRIRSTIARTILKLKRNFPLAKTLIESITDKIESEVWKTASNTREYKLLTCKLFQKLEQLNKRFQHCGSQAYAEQMHSYAIRQLRKWSERRAKSSSIDNSCN